MRRIGLSTLLVLAFSTPVLAAPAPAPKSTLTRPRPAVDLTLPDVVLLARDNSLGAQLNRKRLSSTLAQRQVTVSSACTMGWRSSMRGKNDSRHQTMIIRQ